MLLNNLLDIYIDFLLCIAYMLFDSIIDLKICILFYFIFFSNLFFKTVILDFYFQVIAQLPEGTASELRLLYFSKHYDIACFKITAVSGINVVSLDPKVEFGSEACVVARDTTFGLVCRHTVVNAVDPRGHQKNNWLFIGSQIPMVIIHSHMIYIFFVLLEYYYLMHILLYSAAVEGH